MGAACSMKMNVVEPYVPPPSGEDVVYNVNPLPVMNGGIKGIRNLREQGSEYWGEKYVGDI